MHTTSGTAEPNAAVPSCSVFVGISPRLAATATSWIDGIGSQNLHIVFQTAGKAAIPVPSCISSSCFHRADNSCVDRISRMQCQWCGVYRALCRIRACVSLDCFDNSSNHAHALIGPADWVVVFAGLRNNLAVIERNFRPEPLMRRPRS